MSKPNLLRVTQMNAVYFDNEIYKLLSDLIQDALKYLPADVAARFNNELNLLLKLLILNYSLVKSNSTFGQKLLNVRYDNLILSKKVMYVIGSCMGYVKDKIELWNPSHAVIKHLTWFCAFVQICSFVNISMFLRLGEKPKLIERILGLKQVYVTSNVQRHNETQYMTRELLWDGFIEVLLYVLPLINYHKAKRTIKYLNPFHKKTKFSAMESRNYSFSTKCPHCNEFPILPHHMGCSHIFCYSCLKGNQLADSKYGCPICEYSAFNNICERVSVI